MIFHVLLSMARSFVNSAFRHVQEDTPSVQNSMQQAGQLYLLSRGVSVEFWPTL